MSTSKNIVNIQDIVSSHKKEQCKQLKSQWSKDIEDSNIIIEKIKNNKKYIAENEDKVIFMVERLNQELDYYNEVGIDLDTILNDIYRFTEIRRNLEKNYRQLSLEYYNYNIEKSKIQYEKITNNLKKIKNSQGQIENKMNNIGRKINNINTRVEGLGATFLDIVLTISITSTMVTVLLNTTPQYSITIILGCAWLLLSAILFIGPYFKREDKDNENMKFAKNVYIILTIVTLISFILGMLINIDKYKETDESERMNQNTSIWIK